VSAFFFAGMDALAGFRSPAARFSRGSRRRFRRFGATKSDNVSVTIEGDPPLDEVREHLGSLHAHEVSAVPDPKAIENLKFSEALPRVLADQVYLARFKDEKAVYNVLMEPMRVVSEG